MQDNQIPSKKKAQKDNDPNSNGSQSKRRNTKDFVDAKTPDQKQNDQPYGANQEISYENNAQINNAPKASRKAIINALNSSG